VNLRNNALFNLYQAVKFRFEHVAGDPAFSSGEKGRAWVDTSINKLKWNDGTAVRTVRDTGTPIVDGDITNATISNAKLATNPLARANHTGTQTASTISDFATVRDQQRLDQHAAPTAAVALGSQRITGLLRASTRSFR
jgi:hypothetical protein